MGYVEDIQKNISDNFVNLLGRKPTATEVKGWLPVLVRQANDPTWLQNALKASQEFERRIKMIQSGQIQPPQAEQTPTPLPSFSQTFQQQGNAIREGYQASDK